MSSPTSPLAPVLVDRLIQNTAALPDGADLAVVLAAHQSLIEGPHGEVVGALAVPASLVESLRPLADPEGLLPVALVADGGLLALQEARHAIQDDTWIELGHVEIALPDGFEPADATRALLAELAFTVPTYVELPRTGFETALDVLAEDGVEHAAYRCSGHGVGGFPTDGELASFVHACVDRGVGFRVVAGADHALRTDGAHPCHGVLNVLAAVVAAQSGATTTELAELLATGIADALLPVLQDAPARRVREAFHGFSSGDVGTTLTELVELGTLA